MIANLACNVCGNPRTEQNCRLIPKNSGLGKRLFFMCRDCERAKDRLRQREPRHGGKWRRTDKTPARAKVSAALRNGTLVRKPCEVCGDKAQAHHEDYGKPLEVRWLCRKHHAMEHWKPTDSPLMAAVIASRLPIHERAQAEGKVTR